MGTTDKDLECLGYTDNGDGSWTKKGHSPASWADAKPSCETAAKLKGFPKIKAHSNFVEIDLNEYDYSKVSVLTIDGLIPGLNGSKGLMRAHWSANTKAKKYYCRVIENQMNEGKIRKHAGKVHIHFVGYKSTFMDWDNFVSSGKLCFDALVKMGVMTDDSPKVVVKFTMDQIKCKRVDQKVVVIITDAE
jgi:hypothetical protein